MKDATPTTTTAIDPAKLYTLGECMKLTGFGRDLLAQRCDTNVLPCRRAKSNGRWAWRMVLGADLIAFLAASGVTNVGVTVPTTKPAPPPAPQPAPPATPSAAVRRKRRAEHLRALEEIGCG